MDWSFRRNFLWVSSPGLHTLSREKFVSFSLKYQGRVEFWMLFKLLHTEQLNTALKTATSSRFRSIFSSNSWWEMCSSGNRTRSVRPGGKYRSIQHAKISDFWSNGTRRQPFSSEPIWNPPPRNRGCLPFLRKNRLGRALNNGKSFSKVSKPTERNGPYHLHFDFS